MNETPEGGIEFVELIPGERFSGVRISYTEDEAVNHEWILYELNPNMWNWVDEDRRITSLSNHYTYIRPRWLHHHRWWCYARGSSY